MSVSKLIKFSSAKRYREYATVGIYKNHSFRQRERERKREREREREMMMMMMTMMMLMI